MAPIGCTRTGRRVRSTACSIIPSYMSPRDVEAYAAWAGRVPTEIEWEYAARGGRDGAAYAWGDVLQPGAAPMANTWQGNFPYENLSADGWERTSPVGAYSPNGSASTT